MKTYNTKTRNKRDNLFVFRNNKIDKKDKVKYSFKSSKNYFSLKKLILGDRKCIIIIDVKK